MERYWWRPAKVVKLSRYEGLWSCRVWSWRRRIAPSITVRLTSRCLVPSQMLLSQGTIRDQTFESSPSLRGHELWKTRKGSCFLSSPSLATRWQASTVQVRSQGLKIPLWEQSLSNVSAMYEFWSSDITNIKHTGKKSWAARRKVVRWLGKPKDSFRLRSLVAYMMCVKHTFSQSRLNLRDKVEDLIELSYWQLWRGHRPFSQSQSSILELFLKLVL